MDESIWKKRYLPPDESHWKGRQDPEESKCRFFEKTLCVDLLKNFNFDVQSPCYGFIGFASDEGIKRNQGRQGAFKGPKSLRQSLANLPLHNLDSATLIDFGDVVCEDEDFEATQQALGELTALLLSFNIFPIVLGGDHGVAWGVHQGLIAANPNESISVINYDAHLDLRALVKGYLGSSGTSFLQIAQSCEKREVQFDYTCLGLQKTGNTKQLMAKGAQYNTKVVYAQEFFLNGAGASLELIRQVISSKKPIHLTLCLDVFAASCAPGVSSPQPLGLLPWHVIPGLQELARSGQVKAFDIAELSPSLDSSELTAKLAATLLAQFLYEHCMVYKGLKP